MCNTFDFSVDLIFGLSRQKQKDADVFIVTDFIFNGHIFSSWLLLALCIEPHETLVETDKKPTTGPEPEPERYGMISAWMLWRVKALG